MCMFGTEEHYPRWRLNEIEVFTETNEVKKKKKKILDQWLGREVSSFFH